AGIEPLLVRERDREAVAAALGLGESLRGGTQRRVAVDEEAPRRQRARRQPLLEADRLAPRLDDVARVGQDFAGERREQRGLSAAVAPEQRDALARRARRARPLEQHAPAARQRDAFEPDHRGAGSAASSTSTSSRSPAATGR